MSRTDGGRPLGRGPRLVGWGLQKAWRLPPRHNRVRVRRGVRVPMSDGTVLLADHYTPVGDGPAATVLVRCPYGRKAPFSLLNAQILAERGHQVLFQSCRGTFGSGGAFEPMRHEVSDGRDTVAWLREQDWFDGRLLTFGASYLGFVQWALLCDPPPELLGAVVQVAPHDFSRAAWRDGAFDLFNFLGWSEMVAGQERADRLRQGLRTLRPAPRLTAAVAGSPLRKGARALLGDKAPWFEDWLEHSDLTDPFWTPLQCGDALARTGVPTLLVGGWHDLFLAQTLEQYRVLRSRGVPTRLIVGPWTHEQAAIKAGVVTAESLDWLDRCLAPSKPQGHSARIWTGGLGWQETGDWPPPRVREQTWYLGPDGTLRPDHLPGEPAEFRYDPADPTPSVGGAIMLQGGGRRDNRRLEARDDVLVFTGPPLDAPLEVRGAVTARIALWRDNPDRTLDPRPSRTRRPTPHHARCGGDSVNPEARAVFAGAGLQRRAGDPRCSAAGVQCRTGAVISRSATSRSSSSARRSGRPT
ncbi:CocE/NonD family hydrolase [Actinomadura nitritigenes]|uniref:CocE/NonD family hydrolase n=1 Tax=Actinomadura nitritigenes TaxID=134602 RepID=UPI003D8AD9C3